MDFASIVLFLFIYYIRPQEWIELFAKMQPVKLVMLFSMFATFMRHRGLGPKDFFKTPHDWIMAAYIGWAIWHGGGLTYMFMEYLKYIVFYWIIVIVLTDMTKIQLFLNWWTLMILLVAALAVSSPYFWDPTHSKYYTEAYYKGRLVLRMSIFENPNALGHAVVPVVPMLYYLFLWQRPLFVKEIALVVMALPIWCLYLTYSKGSYLSGGLTLMAGVLFGRPKVVQIAIIIFSMTAGVSIVKSLPRMDELSSSEGGIQGRLAAWGYGYERMHNGPIGWQNFVDNFAAEHGYRKASHSAYVQIGAEFGKWGLFLFIAIFYSTMRTILFVNTKSLEEERIRRMLFVLSVSFFMSSWVIDFATRSTLFMIPACVAAFHRQLLKRHERDVAKAKEDLKQFEENPDEWNGWADLGLQDPSTAARSAGYTERIAKNNQKLALESLKAKVNEPSPIHWPKVNAVDFIVVFLVTRQSIWLWGKVLEGNF